MRVVDDQIEIRNGNKMTNFTFAFGQQFLWTNPLSRLSVKLVSYVVFNTDHESGVKFHFQSEMMFIAAYFVRRWLFSPQPRL